MKCTIIYNKPGENAGADELDVLDQVELFAAGVTHLGYSVEKIGITNDFMNEIDSVAGSAPDFVVNLVESIDNQGELAYFVPALLGLKRIPYTGCPVDALFITGNKRIASGMMQKAGIPVPSSYKPSEKESLKADIRYIIKPVWEDGSMGITADSVFYGRDVGTIIGPDKDDTHWTIEEFVDGREFNISVIDGPDGPEVLPPAEIVFRNYGEERPKIVDFKAKWDTESFEYINSVREFPEDLEESLFSEISKVAVDCWRLFGLKGYARVDLRLDGNNSPRVLEVNANPCISPDSGFIAACKKKGISHNQAVERIISQLNR